MTTPPEGPRGSRIVDLGAILKKHDVSPLSERELDELGGPALDGPPEVPERREPEPPYASGEREMIRREGEAFSLDPDARRTREGAPEGELPVPDLMLTVEEFDRLRRRPADECAAGVYVPLYRLGTLTSEGSAGVGSPSGWDAREAELIEWAAGMVRDHAGGEDALPWVDALYVATSIIQRARAPRPRGAPEGALDRLEALFCAHAVHESDCGAAGESNGPCDCGFEEDEDDFMSTLDDLRAALSRPRGDSEPVWTLDEIDQALYDAHRAWDARNMRSLSDLMADRLKAMRPTSESPADPERSDA